MAPEFHFDDKNYFVVENIQVILEWDLLTLFTIEAMCVSYNHHYL
jgi:hypothetical protein